MCDPALSMNSETRQKLYTLKCDHRPEYLYAYVEGERDNYEISKQYWQEVIDECIRAGYSKLLVVEDIKEQSSMIDTFQLVSEFAEMGLRGIKLAFVDRYAEHDEHNKFGELVAVNRGIQGKIFSTVEEAEKWLLEN